MDISDKLEIENQRIKDANSKYINPNYVIKSSDTLVCGNEQILFKDLQLYATYEANSEKQIEKAWLYKHIETGDQYHLSSWFDEKINLEHLQVEKVDYTTDFILNQLGYVLRENSSQDVRYNISNKEELLFALTSVNENLMTISGEALSNSGFLKWMKSTTIKEEDVNNKTWNYSHKLSLSFDELTIDTSITYDAFYYNGNDEDYYGLAHVSNILNFKCKPALSADFYKLYYSSLCGNNYNTVFDLMIHQFKDELVDFNANEYMTNKDYELEQQKSLGNRKYDEVDPDGFLDSI